MISTTSLLLVSALIRNCSKRLWKSPLVRNFLFTLKTLAVNLKKSISSREGSMTFAEIMLSPKLFARAFTIVVLPVPTSPVRDRNPLFSRIPYFSTARASLCFSPSQRNFGSGLISKGFKLKL